MTEQENGKVKEFKIGKPVIVTGIIWLVTLIVTVIFHFIEKTPDMAVLVAAWSWIVMPIALAAFVLCLLWNHTEDGRMVNIKTIVTVVILFGFMIYFMAAVIMVWIAKVDSMPPEQDNSVSYQQLREIEFEEFS